jgi:hypothetical protein
MQSQKIFFPFNEAQSSTFATITLKSLANHSEKLVDTRSSHLYLKGYQHLEECKCYRFYDRNNTKHDQLSKGVINIPYGFKTPLDFFESIMAEYLAKQFCSLPEIHIISFGSGKLLRELSIIAKLIKALEKNPQSTLPPIYLHAVDPIYKKSKYHTNDEWLKSPSYLCQEQFKNVIKELNLNVSLQTYSSIGKYNQQINNTHPAIIFSIDTPFRYDSKFPLQDSNEQSFTDKKYT